MTKKKCHYQPGDKVKVIAGAYIGRMGVYRRNTKTGKDKGYVMLIGDTFDRCLWKTSLKKLTNDNEEAKEMTLLALHLSGITVEELLLHDGHTRIHTEKDKNEKEKEDGVGE
jgi:hypothetical protein